MLKAVRRIGIGVAARGWSQVTALALALLAARVLGKEGFGVYAIASVFVILLQGMMYGGIYDYIIKSRSEVLDPNTCFWMNFGFSVAGAGGVAVLAPVMGALTHTPLVSSLMLVLAPSALVAAVATWQEALLLREGQLTLYYILGIVTETLACAGAMAALLGGLGVWSYVVYRYAQLGLAAIGYFAFMRQVPRFEWHHGVAGRVFAFAGNIYLSRIVGTVSSYSADLLIGLLVSPASAGAYRLGSRVVMGVSEIIYQPVNTMAWVHFSGAATDAARLRREWLSFATIVSSAAWPALAGLALLSHDVVQLVVGSGWEESASVIVVLAAARAIGLLEVFLDPLMGVRNRTATILTLRVASAVASVSALAVLARHGAVGAGLAQALVAGTFAIVATVLTCQVTGLRPAEIARALLPGLAGAIAAVCAAAATGLVEGVAVSPVMHIAAAVAAGMFAWAIVLALLLRGRSAVLRLVA